MCVRQVYTAGMAEKASNRSPNVRHAHVHACYGMSCQNNNKLPNTNLSAACTHQNEMEEQEARKQRPKANGHAICHAMPSLLPCHMHGVMLLVLLLLFLLLPSRFQSIPGAAAAGGFSRCAFILYNIRRRKRSRHHDGVACRRRR